jgi:hypothetical protein
MLARTQVGPTLVTKATSSTPEVYHRAMGLFRSRARKNREKAAANLVEAQTAPTAPAEVPRREVTAEARPDPDQPGWGRIAGQALGKAREDRQD